MSGSGNKVEKQPQTDVIYEVFTGNVELVTE